MSHEYSTHLPVLQALSDHMQIQTVLEFGGGLYSTPFFLSLPLQRLWTVEKEPDWRVRVATDDPRHQVCGQAPGRIDQDLIFIDDGQNAHQRADTIRRVSERHPKGLVVVHDYEQPEYQDAAVFDEVVVFDRVTPWTGVMWNEDSHHGGGWVHRLALEDCAT